jgi:hypothetical protein
VSQTLKLEPFLVKQNLYPGSFSGLRVERFSRMLGERFALEWFGPVWQCRRQHHDAGQLL